MQSDKITGSNPKQNLVFLILIFTGFILLFLATSKYGAGVSPDSVGYISAARSMAFQQGVTLYDGQPLVAQPPVYSGILGAIQKLAGIDSLVTARYLNLILYILILLISWKLIDYQKLGNSSLAWGGLAAIALSRVLLDTSSMAWSEPLFLVFTLSALLNLQKYLDAPSPKDLIIIACLISLAWMTRYTGVTLYLTAIGIVLYGNRKQKVRAVFHGTLLTIITALPVILWVIRNYHLTGTFSGPRSPSRFTLPENLAFVIHTFADWYLPILISFVLIIVTIVKNRSVKSSSAETMPVSIPIVLFTAVYTVFMIISATTTGFDRLGTRLLSPVYVPLTIIILTWIDNSIHRYKNHLILNGTGKFLRITLILWLVFSLVDTGIEASKRFRKGRVYTSREWSQSELIGYLKEQSDKFTNLNIYSNGPDVAYILADVQAVLSPRKRGYNSSEQAVEVSTLRGKWPAQEGNSLLIWFNRVGRSYLFTPEELTTISDLQIVSELDDGIVYEIKISAP